MSLHVKTYSVTIETDSGKDRVLSCIDPVLLAKDALELAPHIKDAIALSSHDEAVNEAICRDLLEWGGNMDCGEFIPNDFGTSFSDRLHDELQELVRGSQAIHDVAREYH